MKRTSFCIAFLACLFANRAESQIKTIWLTHQSNDPSSIVVNWYSDEPGNSEVFFRAGAGKEMHVVKKEGVKLHHVTIPLQHHGVVYHYRVKTGDDVSDTYSFKGYPTEKNELRVAVVGNWGFAEGPDLSELRDDDPHLLITLGDNVADLHALCGEGNEECIKPFLQLIDSEPDLFRSTPFMPILGNHDKQIRPRGIKYPPVAVYDTNATAYTRFFELPDKEWNWKFSIPNFNVSFVALDLNHVTDLGTTWQTSHNFHTGAEQFRWYKNVMENSEGITITLMNERNQLMRKLENEQWKDALEKGTAVISGFGYYSERAMVNGFPYYTTSLKAGDQYPDVLSEFIKGAGGYMLLRFQRNELPRFEMKTLDGQLIDISRPSKIHPPPLK